ncbi:DUF7507 domain-containing protein, partial [Sphingomicrobium marinum]|uniref:DUF7507 domain-containing protein n=1 Tax=Sphingomicrobium marinum TaxID=1227950 RepID=UPI00223F939B
MAFDEEEDLFATEDMMLAPGSTSYSSSGFTITSFTINATVEPDKTGDGKPDLDITAGGESGTINGAVFTDAVNVGSGTGNYNTFLAIQDNNDPGDWERGFNTIDSPPLDGSNPEIDHAKTEAVLLGAIPITVIDGVEYYEFRVDLNEANSAPNTQISLDIFKLYVSSDGTIQTRTDLENPVITDLVFDMDGGPDGDVSVLLSEANSSGSGTDDYAVLVPAALFAGYDAATTWLYLDVGMGYAGAGWGVNGGFEEWNIQNAVILQGMKFEDLNGNGVQDIGEGPLAGVTIFIDENENGILDDGERFTETDSNGKYSFGSVVLEDSDYSLRIDEVVPDGYVQTTGDFETVLIDSSLDAGTILQVDPIGNRPLDPSIKITKSVIDIDDDGDYGITGVLDSAGDVVTYSITVFNDGELDLTNVVVTDSAADNLEPDQTGGFNDGDLDMDGVLDVGETWTYTATRAVTQAELDSNGDDSSDGPDGDLDNTASVEADSARGPVSDSDDADAPLVQSPALAFDKQIFSVDATGNGQLDHAGEEILYKLVVTNMGNVTLTNVTVVDPRTGTSENVGTLAPGESATVDASYTLTQGDIDNFGNDSPDGPDNDIDNTATADSDQTDAVQDDETVPFLRAPLLTLDKVVEGEDEAGDGILNNAGELIDYSFTVTNIGNVTLTNVIVQDPLTGLDVNVGTLAPGEFSTQYDSYAITQEDLDNNGGGDGDIDNTATADSDQTDPVDDSEEVDIVQNPALMFDKQVKDIDAAGDGILNNAGEIIDYDFVVTNVGNITLTNVTVVDPLTGTNVNIGDLEVGASTTVSGQYAITQGDLDDNGGGDGDIDNTATADSDQTDPTNDSEMVPLVQMPSLMFDKEITGEDAAGNGLLDEVGDVIDYKFTVTNNGNVTLTNVTVVDPLTGNNELVASLAPGDSAMFTGSYAITQTDLDTQGGGDGDIDNTATADSDQTDPTQDSEEAPLVYDPSLVFD